MAKICNTIIRSIYVNNLRFLKTIFQLNSIICYVEEKIRGLVLNGFLVAFLVGLSGGLANLLVDIDDI